MGNENEEVKTSGHYKKSESRALPPLCSVVAGLSRNSCCRHVFKEVTFLTRGLVN